MNLKIYYMFFFFFPLFFLFCSSYFYIMVWLKQENFLVQREQIRQPVIETECTRTKGSRKELSQELLTVILTTQPSNSNLDDDNNRDEGNMLLRDLLDEETWKRGIGFVTMNNFFNQEESGKENCFSGNNWWVNSEAKKQKFLSAV